MSEDSGARATNADWKVRIVVPMALMLVALLARTWRVRFRNADGWQRLRAEGRGFVFVLWHGSLLPLTYLHRGRDFAMLISEHRDGEIIARIAAAWGYRTIRGSTTRGGGRALLSMTAELERGTVVGVTPDGPKGPALTFQPGALVAAQRASVAVVPLAAHASRAWHLNSWDRFVLPMPFARISIAYGDPMTVSGSTPREAAADVRRFELAMQAVQEEARIAARSV